MDCSFVLVSGSTQASMGPSFLHPIQATSSLRSHSEKVQKLTHHLWLCLAPPEFSGTIGYSSQLTGNPLVESSLSIWSPCCKSKIIPGANPDPTVLQYTSPLLKQHLHWMTSTLPINPPHTCRVRTATPSAKRSYHPLLAPPWSLMHSKCCHSPSKTPSSDTKHEGKTRNCEGNADQSRHIKGKNKTPKGSIFAPDHFLRHWVGCSGKVYAAWRCWQLILTND